MKHFLITVRGTVTMGFPADSEEEAETLFETSLEHCGTDASATDVEVLSTEENQAAVREV